MQTPYFHPPPWVDDTLFLSPLALSAKIYLDSHKRRRPAMAERVSDPPSDPEDKKTCRRLKNKIAASESRKRARLHVESIENTARGLIQENALLNKSIVQLTTENQLLKQQVVALTNTLELARPIRPFSACLGVLFLLILIVLANFRSPSQAAFSSELSPNVCFPRLDPAPGTAVVYWEPRLLLDDGTRLAISPDTAKSILNIKQPTDLIIPYSLPRRATPALACSGNCN